MHAWKSWVKPLLFGFLGVILALGVLLSYNLVQEHRALMAWANQVNAWVQQQQQAQQKPAPAVVAPAAVAKPDSKK